MSLTQTILKSRPFEIDETVGGNPTSVMIWMLPAFNAAIPADPPLNSTQFTLVFGRFFSTSLSLSMSA